MDTRNTYREVIERVLKTYAAVPYAHGNVENQTIFDREGDHYLLMIFGQDGRQRVHGCLVHIDLVDNLVIIRRDGTEHGIAPELRHEGIPAEHIILAFHRTGPRPYSEFIAA